MARPYARPRSPKPRMPLASSGPGGSFPTSRTASLANCSASSPSPRRQCRRDSQRRVAGDLVDAPEFSPDRNGAVSRLDDRIVDEQRQSSLIGPVLIELGCNRRRSLSSVVERCCQMRGRLPMRAQTRGLRRSLRREFENARAVVGTRGVMHPTGEHGICLRRGKLRYCRLDLAM